MIRVEDYGRERILLGFTGSEQIIDREVALDLYEKLGKLLRPHAGVTSDGTPVYTLKNPPPEPRGKLPSEAIRERSRERAQQPCARGRSAAGLRVGEPGPDTDFDALLEVLDERLGRAPGKASP